MEAQRIEELDRIDNELSRALVPPTGKANTLGGEMLRAVERLIYRYYNDGDVIGKGYGIETCQSSYFYLEDTLIGFGLIRMRNNRFGVPEWSKPECDPDAAAMRESKYDYSENDLYLDALYNMLELVIDFIENDDRAKLPNANDSRTWRKDDVEQVLQYEEEYEYEDEDED